MTGSLGILTGIVADVDHGRSKGGINWGVISIGPLNLYENAPTRLGSCDNGCKRVAALVYARVAKCTYPTNQSSPILSRHHLATIRSAADLDNGRHCHNDTTRECIISLFNSISYPSSLNRTQGVRGLYTYSQIFVQMMKMIYHSH